MFSSAEIKALLAQRPIAETHPWNSSEPGAVEHFYEGVCARVLQATGTQSKIEWGHYGSGYASFIDAWFYRERPRTLLDRLLRRASGHTGLVILLSRLSPYFVFMEGEKTWHARGGSSYLPVAAMVDELPTATVSALAEQVQPVLESLGLVRVHQAALAPMLPPGTAVPTILGDEPFTAFDALFYWED